MGKLIATDVHVFSNIEDDYNRDFLEAADIVFLSDEGLSMDPRSFLRQMRDRFGTEFWCWGRGARGVAIPQGTAL